MSEKIQVEQPTFTEIIKGFWSAFLNRLTGTQTTQITPQDPWEVEEVASETTEFFKRVVPPYDDTIHQKYN